MGLNMVSSRMPVMGYIEECCPVGVSLLQKGPQSQEGGGRARTTGHLVKHSGF